MRTTATITAIATMGPEARESATLPPAARLCNPVRDVQGVCEGTRERRDGPECGRNAEHEQTTSGLLLGLIQHLLQRPNVLHALLDHRLQLLRNLLGLLRFGLRDEPVGSVWRDEETQEHDQEQQEGEEGKQAPVGERHREGAHAVFDVVADNTFANFDDTVHASGDKGR